MISAITQAEVALERGDYGLCIALLEPIAKDTLSSDEEDAQVRMLMVTALMGQGDEKKAISTCRVLTKCKELDLRQNAKQLLSVLEAPSLQRPSNWSIKLPNIETSAEQAVNNYSARGSNQKKVEEYPPTGLPQDLDIGFAVLVLIVVTGLTILLSS